MQVVVDVSVFIASTQWVHDMASFNIDCLVISLEMSTLLFVLVFILFYPKLYKNYSTQ
jgi:hypothetical protein